MVKLTDKYLDNSIKPNFSSVQRGFFSRFKGFLNTSNHLGMYIERSNNLKPANFMIF